MKTKIVLLISIIAFFIGCKKEDTRPECEKNNVGSIKVENYLSDPYKIYIDNAYKGTVSSNHSVTYSDISKGTHATKYVQESGYVFTPTEYTQSVTTVQCETFTVSLQ